MITIQMKVFLANCLLLFVDYDFTKRIFNSEEGGVGGGVFSSLRSARVNFFFYHFIICFIQCI